MKDYLALWRFNLAEGFKKIEREQNEKWEERERRFKRDERNKTIRQILLFVVFAIIALGMIYYRGRVDALSDRVTGALLGVEKPPPSHAGEAAKGVLHGALEESHRRNASLDEIQTDIGGK
jgi:hypothetical protein